MKVLPAVLLAALFFSPASAHEDLSLDHEGLPRLYHVHVPSDLRTPRPLVFVFHGAGGDGSLMEEISRMGKKAEEKGFIAVFPNGFADARNPHRSWNAGNCCGSALLRGVDDVGFVKGLLAAVRERYPIDPDRIYAAGFSNGGQFVYNLACRMADTFAAVASVGGAFNVEDCRPSEPVSLLVIHGTADANVLYEGGVSREPGVARSYDRPVKEAVDFWRRHDGTGPVAARQEKGGVVRETWAGGKGGTEVRLLTLRGFGHEWPYERDGVSAASEIWDFFERNPKRRAGAPQIS